MKILLLWLFLLFPNIGKSGNQILIWKEQAQTLTLDKYTIENIFTRKITRWPNGQPICVFIKPKNSIEHKAFVKSVLGISPSYYDYLLNKHNEESKPNNIFEVANDFQMMNSIESTPGSIGYINYEIYVGDKRVIVIDTN